MIVLHDDAVIRREGMAPCEPDLRHASVSRSIPARTTLLCERLTRRRLTACLIEQAGRHTSKCIPTASGEQEKVRAVGNR